MMLQSSLSVKPKQISERFGIGIRTVYRDIRSLEESGIPVAGDSRTGYSLVEGFKLPPLMFTEKEAFAFLAAERLVSKFGDRGLGESYKSGIDKIRAVMPQIKREKTQTIDSKIGNLDFDSPFAFDAQNRLQTLLESISLHHKVEIVYRSYSKNEVSQRIIDPIGIFFSMANWYIIGFCNEKNDYRTFRVSRIREIKQTDKPIDRKHPPLDDFLMKIGRQDDLQRAIIEVDRKDMPVIDERKYYQGLVSEEERDDRIELHFMTFSLERLARWYLSYMDIATIIYPQDLKDIVNGIISKARKYK